jgi:hypothetical protein
MASAGELFDEGCAHIAGADNCDFHVASFELVELTGCKHCTGWLRVSLQCMGWTLLELLKQININKFDYLCQI